jgi:hypothetical protein
MPVSDPTVASEELLLDHVPPEIPSDKVTIEPSQTCIVPVIGATGFTVIGVEIIHPVGKE